MTDAFDAISSSITSGLSSGTVHDSLPDGVTCISGDFEGNRNLTGATGEPGEGGVTTYTYTKTYTVKIDPRQSMPSSTMATTPSTVPRP